MSSNEKQGDARTQRDPDLAGAHGSIAGSNQSVAQPQGEPQPTPGSTDQSNSESVHHLFATNVHQYIRDNIQFADQKAAFFFAGTTALLALMYKEEIAPSWMKPLMQWNLLDLAAFFAVVGLAVGSALALLVIIPRLRGSLRGILFWEAITQYQSSRHYADDVARLTEASLAQAVSEHCYDLARVCRRKYRFLQLSIYASALGVLASVCMFVFSTPTDDDRETTQPTPAKSITIPHDDAALD